MYNANDPNDPNNNDTSATHDGPTYDVPPAATYPAHAREWAWDTDKDGNPCIAFVFTLDDSDAHAFSGYQLDGRLYLDEEKQDAKGRTALDRSMEALRAMGLKGNIPEDLGTLDLSVGGVNLVTDINEKGYAKVKFINARGFNRELRTFAPPAAPALKGFLAKLNARGRALDAKAAASGTKPIARPAQSAQPNTAMRSTTPTTGNARTQQPAPQRQAAPAHGPGFGARKPPHSAEPPDTVGGYDDDVPF